VLSLVLSRPMAAVECCGVGCGVLPGLCQSYIGMAQVLGTFLFGPLVYMLTQLAFLVLLPFRGSSPTTGRGEGSSMVKKKKKKKKLKPSLLSCSPQT